MKNYHFYNDSEGWFLHLPDSGFDKMDLQMVAGADIFCDIIAQGEDNIYVTMSTEPFNGCSILHFSEYGRLEGPEYGEGAWYFLNEYKGIDYNLEMWLCDVTKYVFGDFPNKIYFN